MVIVGVGWGCLAFLGVTIVLQRFISGVTTVSSIFSNNEHLILLGRPICIHHRHRCCDDYCPLLLLLSPLALALSWVEGA
jgi:hypothetical protein